MSLGWGDNYKIPRIETVINIKWENANWELQLFLIKFLGSHEQPGNIEINPESRGKIADLMEIHNFKEFTGSDG